MRYFKYKNINKNINYALKEQYKTLTACEKRTVRKEERWRKFSTIITLIVYFSCIVIGIYWIKSIPHPSFLLWRILVIIGKVLTGLILFIVSALVTYGLTFPLWRKVESFHLPTMKKEILSKQQGVKHLIAELKADKTFFLLGYRAKGFIEKNFIAKYTEEIYGDI